MQLASIHTILLFFGIVSFRVHAESLAEIDFSHLDYTQMIEEGSIVFVPKTIAEFQSADELKNGPVFYKQYIQEATKPSKSGGALGVNVIRVSLVPKARRDGSYEQFVKKHKVNDAQMTWFAAKDSACAPSQAINDLLGFMDKYKPVVVAGAYPALCTLVIRYFDENSEQVLNLVNNNAVIKLAYSIPLCASSSPVLDTPEFFSDLENEGVLKRSNDAEMPLQGSAWDTLYQSVKLSIKNPEKYADLEPKDLWNSIRGTLTWDFDNDKVRVKRSRAIFPVVSCAAQPVKLQF
ncbi:MAG: hypothetical protein KBD78_08310 [Oligoflexales bacterium]|nr:hypothetical protein [Oligoflexales bacterium]